MPLTGAPVDYAIWQSNGERSPEATSAILTAVSASNAAASASAAAAAAKTRAVLVFGQGLIGLTDPTEKHLLPPGFYPDDAHHIEVGIIAPPEGILVRSLSIKQQMSSDGPADAQLTYVVLVNRAPFLGAPAVSATATTGTFVGASDTPVLIPGGSLVQIQMTANVAMTENVGAIATLA